MNRPHVVILGAGAAGVAAARALAVRDDIAVTLLARTGETPYIRMHIKGVGFGPTPPEIIYTPLPRVDLTADTAIAVDTATRQVQLASGSTLSYDALLVATGSTARPLEPALAAQAPDGTVTTFHSLDDALRVRAALQGQAGPARVAIYGGGITAAEAASMLRADGHHVALISRSPIPGQAAFGPAVAEQLTAGHRAHVTAFLGRTITRLDAGTGVGVRITLDDDTTLPADLLLVALGTTPSAPAPWEQGVDVDDRLRAADPGVYAAGGVAIHHDDHLGSWRIDHWEDGAAQGAHATAVMLHDLQLGTDPGPYRPRSAFIAMVYGTAVAGVGYTHTGAGEPVPGDELVHLHSHRGIPVGVTGVDAIATVYQWGPRLHTLPA